MLRMWHTGTRHLQRLSWSGMLAVTVVAGFILGACTTQEPTPMTAPQGAATPTAAALATQPAQVSYQPEDVPEAYMRIEIPTPWQRLSPDWAWAATGVGWPRLGMAWQDLQPPAEPEAVLLPGPAQVLSSEPVDLAWGSGRRVTLEVYAPGTGPGEGKAPIQSVETHVLIVLQAGSSRRAYDLFAAGRSAQELESIEPMLQHLLDTAVLDQDAVAATLAAEYPVPGAEVLEAALAASLMQDPEALCEWEVWGRASEELYVWAVCETSSGSAASAPAVIRLSASGKVESVRRPRDGTYYGSDIQDMFPRDVQQRILASEFDAVAAMNRIAQRRAASQGPQAREPVAVTIYFGNSELNPNIEDCRLVYPVVRLVTADDDSDTDPSIALAKAALVELFAGPTEAELDQGYVSMFSAQTASILRGLNVEGQTAYVNLADIRQSISAAGTSCGGQAFLAEVGQTVQAVLPIDRVLYAIEGDPAAFYDFMQFGCDDANDFCDPAPFEQDEN